jgi:hypothetical protein
MSINQKIGNQSSPIIDCLFNEDHPYESFEKFFKCRNLAFSSKWNADLYLILDELLFKHIQEGKI